VPELNYTQITEIVNGLDLDFQTLRTDARGRYELYSLRRDPYVPEEIAREGKVRMISPLVIHAAQAIRSDIMLNPTEVTVIPLQRERDGSITQRMERMAENLERSLAIIWGRMNEGRQLDRDIVWHQLVSPFGIMILEFNEFIMPDQPEWMTDEVYAGVVERAEANFLPWSVSVPDPMTCSWMERDGKPVIFARKYTMSVRDVESAYSNNRGSTEPEKSLRLDGEAFKWYSDDTDARDYSGGKAGFREVKMLWLDDGEHIYHVCENPSGTGGQVLWSAPNPTGRCTAFIVPGNTTPARKPEDRYEPFLLPLMQSVMQVNNIRSMRATAARNLAGPHNYIAVDPEYAKMKLARGEKFEEIRWKKGVTPQIIGEVRSLPGELSSDWDRVETAVNEEMQRFLPSPFVHIVDPAVLKAATATSILHAAETGMRVYGPLMSSYDAAKRDMFESILHSVTAEYADLHLVLHAEGSEMARGRNLKEGSVYMLDADAIAFAHRITVRSRGMSQAQAAAQFDLALRQWTLPDGSRGPATFDDIIDAANYTDRPAQKNKLAAEAILSSIDPWLQQMAIETAADEIFLDSGIELPIGPPPAGGQDPSRIPGGAQRMDAPLVPNAEGASSDTPPQSSF
jgi:hypothetical protein